MILLALSDGMMPSPIIMTDDFGDELVISGQVIGRFHSWLFPYFVSNDTYFYLWERWNAAEEH